jgi:L-methionine (R)-S-oxide reductase
VPLVVKRETQLVLDVDSDKLNDFDAADQKYLEAIVGLIRKQHFA